MPRIARTEDGTGYVVCAEIDGEAVRIKLTPRGIDFMAARQGLRDGADVGVGLLFQLVKRGLIAPEVRGGPEGRAPNDSSDAAKRRRKHLHKPHPSEHKRPGLKTCPHCNARVGEKRFDRHIETCPKRLGGSSETPPTMTSRSKRHAIGAADGPSTNVHRGKKHRAEGRNYSEQERLFREEQARFHEELSKEDQSG